MRLVLRLFTLFSIILICFTQSSIAASFQGLGALPGGSSFSIAYDISADGSTVVGRSYSETGLQAFRWTSSSGMVGLGNLPGASSGDFSEAYAVSADGSTVVGLATYNGSRAFVWTQPTGMFSLGGLPGGNPSNRANAVSADGSIVLGSGSVPGGSFGNVLMPGHWTSDNGIFPGNGTIINGFNAGEVESVSSDGSTIAVYGSTTTNGYGAYRKNFRWHHNLDR